MFNNFDWVLDLFDGITLKDFAIAGSFLLMGYSVIFLIGIYAKYFIV